MQLILWSTIIIVSVVLDFITKKFAVFALMGGPAREFIPGLINFQYNENTGAFFGMMRDNTLLLVIISFVALAIVVAFMVVNRKKMCPLLGIGLAMIVGGGIGNQISRIAYGHVVDFIHFDFYFPVIEDFPIYNVADIFVTVGAIAVIIAVLFFEKNLFADSKLKTDKEKSANE